MYLPSPTFLGRAGGEKGSNVPLFILLQILNIKLLDFSHFWKLFYLFNSINNKPEFQDLFVWYFCQIFLLVLEYLNSLPHPTFSLDRAWYDDHETWTIPQWWGHKMWLASDQKQPFFFCYEMSSGHTHILLTI